MRVFLIGDTHTGGLAMSRHALANGHRAGRAGGGGQRRSRVAAPPEGYPLLQETVGHVHWPLGEIVTPQLLPLPLGVAFSTYWLGKVALTFQVE